MPVFSPESSSDKRRIRDEPDYIRAHQTTLHTTELWLRDLMQDLGWQDRCRAYREFRLSSMPSGTDSPWRRSRPWGATTAPGRGIYYEGWSPSGKPLREIEKEDFFAHIAAALKTTQRSMRSASPGPSSRS